MVTKNENGDIITYPDTRTDFVELEDNKKVKHFLKEVMKENASIFAQVSSVEVMAYKTEEDAKNATDPLGASEPLEGLGKNDANALVVVVPATREDASIKKHAATVITYGSFETMGSLQGVMLSDERTLPRTALTDTVIKRLNEKHVLLVKSPPMTGKTSLAALVSRELEKRSEQQLENVVIGSFSPITSNNFQTFDAAFKHQCGIDWNEFISFPTKGYNVYLLVDEAQTLYNDRKKNSDSSPERKSSGFWGLVKLVRSTGFNMRILLFAAYGSNLNYNELVTPIDFPPELRMGIDSLNFNSDEIHEYVRKWFKGYALLESYVDLFCEFLSHRQETTLDFVPLLSLN